MGKVFKALLIVAAIVVNVIPGGQIFGAALDIASSFGLSLTATLTTATLLSEGIIAGATLAGLSSAASLLAPHPSVALAQLDRLNASLTPSTGRKFVFGRNVAMQTHIGYLEQAARLG